MECWSWNSNVNNDRILIFGGRSTRNDYDRITRVGGECTNNIREYNVQNNKWTTLSVKTPRAMESFGCYE